MCVCLSARAVRGQMLCYFPLLWWCEHTADLALSPFALFLHSFALFASFSLYFIIENECGFFLIAVQVFQIFLSIRIHYESITNNEFYMCAVYDFSI